MADRNDVEQRTPGLMAPNIPGMGMGEGMVPVEAARAAQTVYMQMLAARNFPRNTAQALDRILLECGRLSLAEQATYEYPRGGTKVTGPSIRLAEVIAQNWTNMDFGLTELAQSIGRSTVQAHAFDLETNVRVTRTFEVQHVRISKDRAGNPQRTDLDDPRDIYEMTANQGQRRVRACILELIPGDIVDQAVAACQTTLREKVQLTKDKIQDIINGFAEIGVTMQQLEGYLSRHMDAITHTQYLQLRRVYQSIHDGMSSPENWFGPSPEGETGSPPADGGGVEGLKSKLKDRETPQDASQAPTSETPTRPQDDSQSTENAGEQTETLDPKDFAQAEAQQIAVPEKMSRTGAVQKNWTQWGNRLVAAIMGAEEAVKVGQWLDANEALLEKAPAKVKTRVEDAARGRIEALTQPAEPKPENEEE